MTENEVEWEIIVRAYHDVQSPLYNRGFGFMDLCIGDSRELSEDIL